MTESPFLKREVQGFTYVDEGPKEAPILILLHGMLGGIGNWTRTISDLSDSYRLIVPFIPMYSMPIKEASISGLVTYVEEFIQALALDRFSLIGNSIGGHLAVYYAHQNIERIESLILTGASGIYEMEWGPGVIKRRDTNFIREKAAKTFFDPKIVTDELVDFLKEVGSNRDSVIRLLKIARSSKAEKVDKILSDIDVPSLLIWGQDDIVTPAFVAKEFLNGLPNARLLMFDQCGHAPMIEKPELFNKRCREFLDQLLVSEEV